MCMDDLDNSPYNAYTMTRKKIMSDSGDSDEVLGTDYNGGAFKFDPSTRTLTMSETTPFIGSDGTNYEGSV